MDNTKKLTNKQKKVLDFISDYISKNGKSPLIQEIQEGLSFKSTRSVSQYLDALVKKGYICKTRNPRSIELVNYYENFENETVLIPLRGTSSCGTPEFFADDNIEEHLSVEKKLLKNNKDNYYLIRASGTSMDKAGINNLSLVLVEKTDDYKEGDNVIAILNGLATVKKIIKGESAVMLTPVSSNLQHKPIIVKDDFQIAGKVVSVLPDPANLADIQYIKIDEDNY